MNFRPNNAQSHSEPLIKKGAVSCNTVPTEAAKRYAVPGFWVGEYFFDHSRTERMFFDGTPQPIDGMLKPDRSRPGLGLEFKRADAARHAV